ncbi:hypothetical protein LENED_001011 [Lentinula edodes]|uniref:Uncharacterized protein n=1 Tax=Lentinula edodes TaxID=5353 RepID=A0A1Q3DXT0_LENED|nr:hypothetical protein LENED_001011 [Lentinula edodes]
MVSDTVFASASGTYTFTWQEYRARTTFIGLCRLPDTLVFASLLSDGDGDGLSYAVVHTIQQLGRSIGLLLPQLMSLSDANGGASMCYSRRFIVDSLP